MHLLMRADSKVPDAVDHFKAFYSMKLECDIKV